MAFIPSEDFFLKAALGKVSGYETHSPFGINDDIDTTEEDLIIRGGLIVWPTSAESLEVVSSSANDTSAGTGTRQVKVEGLDGSYAYQTENVTMNGISAVALANTYTRVYAVEQIDAGTGGVNAGTINVRVSGGGANRLEMGIGNGVDRQCSISVPTGYTGVVTRFYGGINSGSGASPVADIKLNVRLDISDTNHYGLLIKKRSITVRDDSFERTFKGGLAVPGPADVFMSASTSQNNTAVHGGFDIVIVQD